MTIRHASVTLRRAKVFRTSSLPPPPFTSPPRTPLPPFTSSLRPPLPTLLPPETSSSLSRLKLTHSTASSCIMNISSDW